MGLALVKVVTKGSMVGAGGRHDVQRQDVQRHDFQRRDSESGRSLQKHGTDLPDMAAAQGQPKPERDTVSDRP